MLFNQVIGFIEPTEELKRVNADTKTVTQPKTHVYTDTAYNITCQGVDLSDTTDGVNAETALQWFQRYITPPDPNEAPPGVTYPNRDMSYVNLYAKDGVIQIKALAFWYQYDGSSTYPTQVPSETNISITTPSGETSLLISGNTVCTGETLYEYVPTETGVYTIRYQGGCGNAASAPNPPIYIGAVTYTVEVVRDVVLRPRKTIPDVINTILNYSLGARNRHYVLDPACAEKWWNIKSPEFFFTRNTLYEVLLTIGGYDNIQAIPRLKWADETTKASYNDVALPDVGYYDGGEWKSAPNNYKSFMSSIPTFSFCIRQNGEVVQTNIWITKHMADGSSTRTLAMSMLGDFDGNQNHTEEADPAAAYYTVRYWSDGGSREYAFFPLTSSSPTGMRLITFESTETTEEWTPPGATAERPYGDFIDFHVEQSTEDYFTGLDSYADNIIDNTVNGSVGLPIPTSPRCESEDLAITDNTVMIETPSPTYKVDKAEQWYSKTIGVNKTDITPYIFEKSEYDLLTDYVGQFPTAKQYAMYYAQGAKNIRGLTLKPEVWDFLGINQNVQEVAAVKIFEAASGEQYDEDEGLARQLYRIKYTPIQSRRLKQYRTLVDDRPSWNVSYYNQSANTLDAKNFGNNMKFMLAQKGNRLTMVTYRLLGTADGTTIMSQIPKPGQTLNGDFMSQVDVEQERHSVKITVWAVKNYNRKSQYVELNANKRFYEVSEKQSVLRTLNRSFEYRFGAKDAAADWTMFDGDDIKTITGQAPDAAADDGHSFYPIGEDTTKRISQVYIRMYNADDGGGEQIGEELLLPVSATGVGNSMAFHFEMADNYSAGNQAISYDGQQAKRMLRAVPYGDDYGEFVSMAMVFCRDTVGIVGSNPLYSEYESQAFALPQFVGTLPPSGSIVAFSRTVNVAKDSREQIAADIQVHFRATRASIVIGSALGERMPYVNAHTSDMDDSALTYVALPYTFTPLQNTVAATDVEEYAVPYANVSYTADGDDGYYLTQISGVPSGTKAWALVVTTTGDILFGENVTPTGSTITYPTSGNGAFYVPLNVKEI